MAGLLLFGDTVRSGALRHEIPLAIIGPLLFAEGDRRRVVLTSWLERDRIARALPDAEVLDFYDLGWKDLVAGGIARQRVAPSPPVTNNRRSSTTRTNGAPIAVQMM